MKLALGLLIVVSLVVAVLGAVTAYVPRLSLPDEQLIGTTLGSDAGVDASGKPLVPAKTKLTAEHLSILRAANVPRVRVLEFSVARWSGLWLFAGGAAGLLAGGLLIRAGRSRPSGATAGGAPMELAVRQLSEIRGVVKRLRADLAGMPEGDRSAAVVERLNPVQRDLIPAFLSGRTAMVSALGLAGFAQAMERFAVGERSLNRAWSAAADGFPGELDEELGRAEALLGEAELRLGAA